ncbi:MAG TPA: TonB-dependent receptor [Candidatus Ozemobacteraceae bacterium]|nr:TonB-dependent receptor [Candidatus Ozemobacteraceae bacterium]
MRWKTVGVMMAILACCQPASAKDTYDMGQVQVVGKDAQSDAFAPNPQDISMSMGEKDTPLPDLLPEQAEPEALPLVEKAFPISAPRAKTDEVSLAIGRGGSGTQEYILRGKGSYNGYVGDIRLERSFHDGFNSFTDDKKYAAHAAITSLGEGSYELTTFGDLTGETFGQRGWRHLPTPDAKIRDTVRSISAKGHATLSDGAFFQARARIDSANRIAENSSISYEEDDTLFSSEVEAEYQTDLRPNLKGKAGLELKKASWSPENANEQDLTKRSIAVSGEFDFKGRSYLELGLKSMGLMGRDRTAPFLRYDYRWAKPWQFILDYDERLQNDDLMKIFMPRRYVATADLKASHLKRTSGTISYRWQDDTTFGLELFSERENDAIEYTDEYLPGRGLLASTLRFVPTARRTGTKIKGSFKLDDHFTLRAATTFQTPKNDDTGARLSYEAKRLLDISFSYQNSRWEGEFSRQAMFDRIAYIPVASVDAGDYSRSDLTLKYKVTPQIHAYVKIKDLYDEAKSIRYAVPEEGRVSLAGIEAHF